MKTCAKCKLEKHPGEFHKNCKAPDGLAYYCKDCIRAHGRARIADGRNADDCRARRAADPQKWRERDAAYRAANPQKKREWTDANRERVAAYQAEYTAGNLALYRAHNAKRAAAQIKATPPWADHEAIKAIYQKARDLSLATGVKYHVDHIIPLRAKLACGLHVQGNLQIIPATVNLRKRNRMEEACPQPL